MRMVEYTTFVVAIGCALAFATFAHSQGLYDKGRALLAQLEGHHAPVVVGHRQIHPDQG